MNYDDLNNTISELYPVNEVDRGYKYWTRVLTEKCLGMFTYTGLPDSLPSEQIELRLITTGIACIFKHSKYGLCTSYGSPVGVDQYYRPLTFTYAQPRLGSKNLELHKEAVLIYNETVDYSGHRGLLDLIRRYARMLADIDSSINICTVNLRATNLVTAKNKIVAKTIDESMKKMRLGEYITINQDSILDCMSTYSFGSDGKNSNVSELLLARESTLRSFLSEIGIKLSRDKKERQIVDEVQSDNQVLTVNTSDMLFQRKKGIDEVNDLFGYNITVELSPEYDPTINEEDTE